MALVIAEALTDAMTYMVESVSSLALPYSWPVPRNRRMKRAVARLDDIIFRIIAERRGAPDRGDVLSMLLEARDEDGTPMDDRQIRDEAMTLVLAGHETTANALAWTLYLLTQHPDVNARLTDEVDRVLAGRTPAMADLPQLPYTLQVLKESMRLYPPAYLMARETIAAFDLGPHHVRRGTYLMVNIFGMHHRADYFPRPDHFDPTRFADEKQLPRGAYLPFGGGERVCIGNHFALMEAQLILATIVQRTRLTLDRDPHITPEPLVTLRPKDGLAMRVARR